jgi:Tfp pilus assembly protein PilF
MDIASLEKMISNGRDSAMLRLTLARLLGQDEQWQRAADQLEKATVLDPGYTAAWKDLGKVRRQLEQEDAAQTAWQKGIEVARSNGDKQAEKEMGVFLRRLSKSKLNRQK